MSCTKYLSIFFYFYFFTFIFSTENTLDIDTTLHNIIEEACPEDEVDTYYNIFSPLIKRTKTATDWIEPLKNSLYPACFLKMSTSKTQIAFKLAYGASQQKIPDQIIENITPLIATNTIGIQAYLNLTLLWKKLLHIGISNSESKLIINYIFNLNFRNHASQLFAWIYIQYRLWGYDEQKSYENAVTYSKDFKELNQEQIYIKKDSIIHSIQEVENKEPNILLNLLNKNNMEESWIYLKSLSIKIPEITYQNKKSITWNENKLRTILQKWYGIHFFWNGDTTKSINSLNLIRNIVYEISEFTLPKSIKEIYNQTTPISIKKVSTGDILFFNTSPNKNNINHIGLYIGNKQIVYVNAKSGVTLASIEDPFLQKKLVSIKRIQN